MSAKLIESLNEVLANTYILMLKTQNYHWNVKGQNFYSSHKLFEEQYNELFIAIDELAERIRSIGGHTKGSFKQYLALAGIKEDASNETNSLKMMKNLIKDQSDVIAVIKSALSVAQKAGDEVSTDLLIGRATAHEKAKWMLESSL